jgi:arsenate reductase
MQFVRNGAVARRAGEGLDSPRLTGRQGLRARRRPPFTFIGDDREVSDRPVVLFACVHNSGRSVAAQLLAQHLAGDAVHVRSAGSDPGTVVNPQVAAVLADRGLSTADHVPSLLTGDAVQAADVVVTMGCGETCPVFFGTSYEDWQVDDPAGQPREVVERIVADIEARVRDLLRRLAVPADS